MFSIAVFILLLMLAGPGRSDDDISLPRCLPANPGVTLVFARPEIDLLLRRAPCGVQADDAGIASIRIVLRRQLHPVVEFRIVLQTAVDTQLQKARHTDLLLG